MCNNWERFSPVPPLPLSQSVCGFLFLMRLPLCNCLFIRLHFCWSPFPLYPSFRGSPVKSHIPPPGIAACILPLPLLIKIHQERQGDGWVRYSSVQKRTFVLKSRPWPFTFSLASLIFPNPPRRLPPIRFEKDWKKVTFIPLPRRTSPFIASTPLFLNQQLAIPNLSSSPCPLFSILYSLLFPFGPQKQIFV